VLEKLKRDYYHTGMCTFIEIDKPNTYLLKRMPNWMSDAELDMELIRLDYEI